MTMPNLYMASQLCGVRALAAQFAGNSQRFDLGALDQRSQRMTKLMVENWPVVMAV